MTLVSCEFALVNINVRQFSTYHGHGLYTGPFVHGVVELSIRDKFFSNRYSSGVPTSLCKLLCSY